MYRTFHFDIPSPFAFIRTVRFPQAFLVPLSSSNLASFILVSVFLVTTFRILGRRARKSPGVIALDALDAPDVLATKENLNKSRHDPSTLPLPARSRSLAAHCLDFLRSTVAMIPLHWSCDQFLCPSHRLRWWTEY